MTTPYGASQTPASRATTVKDIAARKGGEPVVCLTAYTSPIAEILDPVVDLILVGDSASTVLHGYATTVPITIEEMISHGNSVTRVAHSSCVIIDMPFGSYEESPETAFRNASRIMKETEAAGVKLEGGTTMSETIRFLVDRGIPVMGHIGLQPQSVNARGGYAATGRRKAEWDKYLADAKAVEEAGAFALVLEAMAEPLARSITEEFSIVTIGIGASAACDGQILVTDDLLGMFERTPAFVKRYAELRQTIGEAIVAYAEDVKARSFPGPGNTYKMRKRQD